MGYIPFYLFTLGILTISATIIYLITIRDLFEYVSKRKVLSSIGLYFLITPLVSSGMVYFYFYPNGAYVNRGMGTGIIVTILFVLMGLLTTFLINKSIIYKNMNLFNGWMTFKFGAILVIISVIYHFSLMHFIK